ncbi:MAG: hypothetical protein CBC13_06310 [Planctomycetia bacterium TMED53]|nr:MAG: hypothetical protein CBC13_06310 [Planctomycetia bacterium TMED53]
MGPKLMIRNSDPEELAKRLREDLLSCMADGDLLCIPTGRSPLELYQQIREDSDSADRWRSFRYLQLDEYLDPSGSIHSFRDELSQQIFTPLQVPADQIHSIDPQGDPVTQAKKLDQIYDRWGPPKACVLGLGSNGHIAFNEPGSSFSGYTVVDLAQETIANNFPEPQPSKLQALTISLEQIYASQHVFLLVPQPEKSSILDRCLAGPKDVNIPASWLHDHPSLHVYRHR